MNTFIALAVGAVVSAVVVVGGVSAASPSADPVPSNKLFTYAD